MKKYELTSETMVVHGNIVLHRIRALRDFANVKAGDLGGWIEAEKNLSQSGNCWVHDNAKVWGGACVLGNAHVTQRAQVFGRAMVMGTARVRDNAKVYDEAIVSEEAEVGDNVKVYGRSHLHEKVRVINDAEVFDSVRVGGSVNIGGSSILCGNVNLYGISSIYGNAVVKEPADYIVFREWWKNDDRHITWTRSNNMWHMENFHGTAEELIKKADEDSGKSVREYERIVNYVNAILQEEREFNARCDAYRTMRAGAKDEKDLKDRINVFRSGKVDW